MLDFAALAPDSVHPFSRGDYERLVELGLFQDTQVELLRGVVVTMSPQGSWHAVVSARIHEALLRALAGRVFVMSHSPLALSDDSEPEPDVAVYPPNVSPNHLPSQALIVVEVSDTSLSKDRGVKRDLYAEAGVPEYWVVRREPDAVEVYTEPRDGAYARCTVHGPGDSICPTGFGDVRLQVQAFFGSPGS